MYSLEEVLSFLGWILAGIILLRNGLNAVADIVKAFRAPDNAQNERIKKLEAAQKHTAECLKKDKDALDDLRNAITVMIRSQFAVIGHGLDGNNVKEMKDSQEELHDYLLKRK